MKTMNNLNKTKIFFLAIAAVIITSCNNDDDPVNEEEVITTITTTLTNGATTITLTSRDLDLDGPNPPVISVSGPLMANTTYTGKVTLLDETKTPVDNITAEIESSVQEKLDHQFFFSLIDGLTGIFTYTDQDSNGNPIGINFTYTTGNVGSGKLNVKLRHEPNKSATGVAGGNITNAGGATDVDVSYPIVVN
jgi:hypothetical protein